MHRSAGRQSYLNAKRERASSTRQAFSSAPQTPLLPLLLLLPSGSLLCKAFSTAKPPGPLHFLLLRFGAFLFRFFFSLPSFVSFFAPLHIWQGLSLSRLKRAQKCVPAMPAARVCLAMFHCLFSTLLCPLFLSLSLSFLCVLCS